MTVGNKRLTVEEWSWNTFNVLLTCQRFIGKIVRLDRSQNSHAILVKMPVKKIKAKKRRFVEIKNDCRCRKMWLFFGHFLLAIGKNIPSRLKGSLPIHFTIRWSSEVDHKLGHHQRSIWTSTVPIKIVYTWTVYASRTSDFSNHSDDFRPNWTPIASFIITNRLFVRKEAKKRHLHDRVTLWILSSC